MDINEFAARVAEGITDYLPEEKRGVVSVHLDEVMKVNDQVLHGLSIHEGDEPAPTFYMEEMYDIFRLNEDMDQLLRIIADAYYSRNNDMPMPVEVPDMNYKAVKRKAGLRLLGMDYNQKFLQTVPFRDVGNGYALVCEATIKSSDGGVFSTVITNKVAEDYDYNMDRLFEAALDNAWKANEAVFMPACDAAECLEDDCEPDNEHAVCWVLTTNRPRYGAAALFYPGTQAMIAKVLAEDYVAIPSSMHEFIIVRSSQVSDPCALQEMVREANRTIVHPGEVLSDNVLKYSIASGELSLLQNCRFVKHMLHRQ